MKSLVHGSYLFEREVARSERFLDLPVAALLGRLNGGSEPVQDAFEGKLFHIGPRDFPRFLFRFLFGFNGGEFYLLSTAPSQNIFLYFIIMIHCAECLVVAVCCVVFVFLSLVLPFALDRRGCGGRLFAVKICLISVNFCFSFYCYSFSARESFFL